MLWHKIQGAGGVGNGGSFGDLSTATVVQTLDISSYTNSTRWGMALSADGTKLFSQLSTNEVVQCFEFSTPYDLSSYVGGTPPSIALSRQGNARGIYVTPDGTKLFSADDSINVVWEYSFSTAFDITTLNASSSSTTYSIGNSSVRAPMFTNGGANFYNSDTVGTDNIHYVLNDPTPYSPPSSGYSSQTFGSNNNNNYGGILFQPDGLSCYVIDDDFPRVIRRFVLSTPWDISSYSDPSDNYANNEAFSYDISSNGKFIFFHLDNTIYKLALGAL